MKWSQFHEKKPAKVLIPWNCANVFSKGFCPMGEKALQQASVIVVFYLANPYKNTTARSLFGMPKFCYIPWESFPNFTKKTCKALCRFFFVKLSSFYSFTFHFFVKLTENPQFCKIPSIWRKIGKCAKLFFPWDVAKVFCNSKLHYGLWFDGKNWNCKGNFFSIVYLVNHIEILISDVTYFLDFTKHLFFKFLQRNWNALFPWNIDT